MTDILGLACELAQDQWVESLSVSMESHEFGKTYKRKMVRLCNQMRGDHYHHMSKAMLSVLVAAVLIMALMAVSVAYAPARRYIIEVFKDHTEFQVESTGVTSIAMDISFGFIPENFDLIEREIDGEVSTLDELGKKGMVSTYHFEDPTGRWIDVIKSPIGGWYGMDSEEHPIEVIGHNSIDYYYSFSEPDYSGVTWMVGGIQYELGGTLSRENALKMAYQIR